MTLKGLIEILKEYPNNAELNILDNINGIAIERMIADISHNPKINEVNIELISQPIGEA